MSSLSSSAGDRQQKRQRLGFLSGHGNVTDAALVSLAQKLREIDWDGDISRQQLRHATRRANAAPTDYGPWLTSSKPPNFEWHIPNPCALLNNLVFQSHPFGQFLLKVARRSPATLANPWEIIFYTDETHPGNVFRIDSAKKVWRF